MVLEDPADIDSQDLSTRKNSIREFGLTTGLLFNCWTCAGMVRRAIPYATVWDVIFLTAF